MLSALAVSTLLALAPGDSITTPAARETVYLSERINPQVAPKKKEARKAKLVFGLAAIALGTYLVIDGWDEREVTGIYEGSPINVKREAFSDKQLWGIGIGVGGLLLIATR